MALKHTIAWKQRNRTKVLEQRTRYFQKNYDKLYRKKVAWDKANPDKVKEQHKRDYEKHKEARLRHQKEYNKSLEGCYTSYKSNAPIRGYCFKLTVEEFKTFWQKNCTYCHDKIVTIGLDRIDNLKGYIFDNVCSCCATCNYTRGDRFTYEEMLTIIGPAIAKVKALRKTTLSV